MGTVVEHQYKPFFNPGAYSPHWEPVKSENEKIVDALTSLRCVLEEIRDVINGSDGPIITGIHALTEFRRIVDGEVRM